MTASLARAALAALLLGACSVEPPTPVSRAPLDSVHPGRARFYLVGPGGTRASGPHERALQPGYAVAITEEVMLGAERMGRTRLGRLLPMRDLRPTQPSAFNGVAVVDGRLDFAWLGTREAYVWPRPEARGKPRALRHPRELVSLREQPGPRGWLAVDGGWMESAALRIPTLAPRPNEVRADAPWLDIDLASQTLVAYQGDSPVFATLVSTGIGRPGSVFATPRGVHRIVTKLLAATMDNLEHTGVVRYSYEDVPYTQYIGRVALHGAFWHDRFGTPVSHGCINVSVQDAERLFALTRPALPIGETQVSAQPEQSSVIRVR